MSDPERLLDQGSAVEKGLLSAALDEPPPADLLERTLEAVAAAGAAGAAASVAAKAGAAAGAKATGGGILGAIGIGAIAGLLTVGAYEVASSPRAPRPVAAAPAVVSVAAPPIASPPALPELPAPVAQQPAPAPEPAPTARVEAAGSARPSNLAAELALLDEARSALRAGDPARARRELDRYAREIPRGQLAREAAMLRAEVDAALDAGKTIP
jgi:hypothetical protein